MMLCVTDGVTGNDLHPDPDRPVSRMFPNAGLERALAVRNGLFVSQVDAGYTHALHANQTSTRPRAIMSRVNAINATAAMPKNMQIMNIVCSICFPQVSAAAGDMSGIIPAQRPSRPIQKENGRLLSSTCPRYLLRIFSCFFGGYSSTMIRRT